MLPILNANDGRLLPQAFQGSMLTVKEIPNVAFYGGQMRANSPRNDAQHAEHVAQRLAQRHLRPLQLRRRRIQLNGKRTQIGAWFGQLEDIYKQRYFEIKHAQPLAEGWSLSSRLGLFSGEEDGRAEAGDLDNKTLTGLFALKGVANTFTLAFQRLTGDDRWLRLNGMSAGMLPNDVFTTSFDNTRETSWQLRHDYDFAALGVPGLTFMTRYIKGTNVHVGAVDDSEEWARENELTYVVQSGTLKSLSLRLRNASRRADWGSNTRYDENRMIVNYPLSLF